LAIDEWNRHKSRASHPLKSNPTHFQEQAQADERVHTRHHIIQHDAGAVRQLFQSVCWENLADIEEAKQCKTPKQRGEAERSKKLARRNPTISSMTINCGSFWFSIPAN
jgi:hypothetical protein